MLKGQFRLKKNKDFRKVFNNGKSVPTKYLVMYFRPNEKETLRIGFSVSKKLGGAVVRSRIKRIMREAVRKHINEIMPGMDIVLIARNPIKSLKSPEVEESLIKILHKYRLLKKVAK